MLSEIVALIGGTPVTASTSEIYTSVQRGLAGGAIMGWTGFQTFKLGEVSTFHLDVSLGSSPGYMGMNVASHGRLPDALKKAIDKHSGLPWALAMGKASDTVEANVRQQTRALPGHVVAELSEAELARWKKLVSPLIDQWIKDTPDGAKVLAAYRAELAKVRSGL
jgi:TRAP-type C4-dicarboxylate transport system substrate-binding protein